MDIKPTLFKKGSLRPIDNDPATKSKLDDWAPIDYIIDWFRQRLDRTGVSNRVLILKSETASGKSTAFPPELYRALVRGHDTPGIICTQPRILTAIENVMTIVNIYPILRLGENIGWSTKNNKLRMTSNGILSATVGTLAQQLKTMTDDEISAKYKYILIDETHERDLQTDMTIYRLKNLLIRKANNVDCPFVVLMSATFDPDIFLEYFRIPESSFIWCTGAPAEITERWDLVKEITDPDHDIDYTEVAAKVVEKIISNETDSGPNIDILIFAPGKFEFTKIAARLTKINESLVPDRTFSLLQIEGEAVREQSTDYKNTMSIPVSKQIVVIDGTNYTPVRRVILSTNVAETGLTLNNLKYVIDAGFNREIEYNPIIGVTTLITKPAPQSRITQRRGRVGRKFPGVFIPLYSFETWQKLPKLQFPAVLIDNISPITLDLVQEQISSKKLAGKDPVFVLADIDMLNTPTPDALHTGLEKLYTLGFVEPIGLPDDSSGIMNKTNGLVLTQMGEIAAKFIDHSPENIRMLLSSYYWKCSMLDIITIIVWLTMDLRSFAATPIMPITPITPITPIDWAVIYKSGMPGYLAGDGITYRIRTIIGDEFIDGLAMFTAIRRQIGVEDAAQGIKKLTDWCDRCHVSVRACLEFIKIRETMIEQFIRGGLNVFKHNKHVLVDATTSTLMDVVTSIKYCIYDGYRCNVLRLTNGVYYTLNGQPVMTPKLFTSVDLTRAEYSFLSDLYPRVVIYHELRAKPNKKTNIYEISADRISVCDGYISVDDVNFTV